jgi:hypothetical protein
MNALEKFLEREREETRAVISTFLAKNGRKGGKKSSRKLSKREARRIAKIRWAQKGKQ